MAIQIMPVTKIHVRVLVVTLYTSVMVLSAGVLIGIKLWSRIYLCCWILSWDDFQQEFSQRTYREENANQTFDNQSNIQLIKNGVVNKRRTHIDVRFHQKKSNLKELIVNYDSDCILKKMLQTVLSWNKIVLRVVLSVLVIDVSIQSIKSTISM